MSETKFLKKLNIEVEGVPQITYLYYNSNGTVDVYQFPGNNITRERKKNPINGSYTNKLLSDKELAKEKVLEEINELIEAVDKNENQTISDLYNELTVTFSSPTMSPKCPEESKYKLVEKIEEIFQHKKKNNETVAGQKILSILTINGVRIHLEDGSWGLVRASSNSPNLVVVCESTISEERMKEIFNDLNNELMKFNEIGEYDQKI